MGAGRAELARIELVDGNEVIHLLSAREPAQLAAPFA
jgi:hypothetical protein